MRQNAWQRAVLAIGMILIFAEAMLMPWKVSEGPSRPHSEQSSIRREPIFLAFQASYRESSDLRFELHGFAAELSLILLSTGLAWVLFASNNATKQPPAKTGGDSPTK